MKVHPVTGRVAHGIAGDGVFVDGREIKPRWARPSVIYRPWAADARTGSWAGRSRPTLSRSKIRRGH